MITTESFELAVYASGDEDAEKLALVLPGFLDTKDYPHMTGHVDYLAKKGYFALSFDPPGTWGSKGSIDLYNCTNYLQAIDELVELYKNKKVFLIGHSMGGRMALLAAARNTKITSLGIVMSVLAFVRDRNFEERVTRWKKVGMRTFYRDIPGDKDKKKRFTLPYSFSIDAQKYDAPEILKKVTQPKLFIIGKHDITVTFEEAKETYDLAPQPKELHMLDSDHDYRHHPKLIKEVNGIIGKLLENT